ncbi:uncharacterized protein LY89DRAFT_653328 [Mollisia scopiformis]|uniref:RBR-type E3 ubiquitin transferase n=1 Tax=Mollisia scopiformis TaxID=149040 RepID=A0A194WV58_MOLSC|nr:uncharacterized protein LY89DRAFT_653328 [Mollisia scopiformis]KUJ11856.1 hypothetical protein LY89DRAFT_653328 [Mollisia scopiformis]
MDLLTTLDEETLALILRLQIDDSVELCPLAEAKGKGREGDLSDSQLAFKVYREDLERNAVMLKDRVITKSIARACQTDGNILTASLAQEQTASSDRETACRLGGTQLPVPVEPWTVSSEFLDDEILGKLSALYVTSPLEDPVSEDDTLELIVGAESSGWATSRRQTKRSRRQCTACQDTFIFCELGRASCGHEYCRGCLHELFSASITDDSLFPPRCCRQPITCGGGMRLFLTTDLVRQYEAKKVEFETADRTYCSNTTCSIFIRIEHIAKEKAYCPECSTLTCVICKSGSHLGDCPEDTALQQVLETAQENGWQRCFNCRRLVELEIGCNHMTCTCGAQFCYLCGEKWKTCGCSQWDENRLLARANQVVARQPAAPVPQQAARLAAVVQDLRHRHNCDHESWRYVGGQHQCEQCLHTLPSYIFECRQCHMQACNRCRRNRL